MDAASSGAHAQSRLSVQASYHHLSMQFCPKVVLHQSIPRSAPPSQASMSEDPQQQEPALLDAACSTKIN